MLSAYCEQREWDYEVIKDLGSGLNYNKKGLLKLLTLIVSGEVQRLVITHKERFLRFGAELIFNLCEIFNTEAMKKSEVRSQKSEGKRVLELLSSEF